MSIQFEIDQWISCIVPNWRRTFSNHLRLGAILPPVLPSEFTKCDRQMYVYVNSPNFRSPTIFNPPMAFNFENYGS